ncbi:MAG: hypothetical protein P9M05_11645 [Candidatus Stygibacter australis]|nr:hypothetical protein [Candidatus Stygibacter australis]
MTEHNRKEMEYYIRIELKNLEVTEEEANAVLSYLNNNEREIVNIFNKYSKEAVYTGIPNVDEDLLLIAAKKTIFYINNYQEYGTNDSREILHKLAVQIREENKKFPVKEYKLKKWWMFWKK